MKSKVLRTFKYAFDGVSLLQASVGDEIDFRDMTDGLAAEGYIEKAAEAEQPEEAPAETPVETPVENTAETPTETPAETPVEVTPETPPETVVDPVVEAPAPVTKSKRK